MQLSKGSSEEQALLRSIPGLLFFGVPSEGMRMESLLPMTGLHTNRTLVESLAENSSTLRDLAERFREAYEFKRYKVFSFYEQIESPTAVQVWSRVSLSRRA